MRRFLRYLFCITGLITFATESLAQTCSQPGALVSVRNSYRSHIEYVVFTFVDPYNYKGDLHKTSGRQFVQLPINNPFTMKGDLFYKITFPNSFALCETKNYTVVPQGKLMDFKLLEKSGNTISYVLGLSKSAKITSHTAYNYHGFHMVKIRME
jgi:hypothetical protein